MRTLSELCHTEATAARKQLHSDFLRFFTEALLSEKIATIERKRHKVSNKYCRNDYRTIFSSAKMSAVGECFSNKYKIHRVYVSSCKTISTGRMMNIHSTRNLHMHPYTYPIHQRWVLTIDYSSGYAVLHMSVSTDREMMARYFHLLV